MTAYLLFAGLGILIYAGVAYANAGVFGLAVLAAVTLFYGNRFWRNVVVALVLLTGGVAIFIAATPAHGYPLNCAGRCGEGVEPSSRSSSIAVPIGAQSVVVVDNVWARLAAGKTLFQKRGCIAGLLTEEELQALIAYVKSLRVPA